MTGKARNFAWLVTAQTDNEDNRHFICDVEDSAEALKLCGFNQNGDSPYIAETDTAKPRDGLLHVYQDDDGECSSCLEDPTPNSPWSIQVIRRDMVNEPIEKLLKSKMDFHTLESVGDVSRYVKEGPRDLKSSTNKATELASLSEGVAANATTAATRVTVKAKARTR